MERLFRTTARRRGLPIAVIGLVAAAMPVGPAAAADPVEVVFASTGAEQTWVVPVGVTSIHVVLVGGHGGNHDPSGYGHVVTGDLDVVSGTTLYIEVGGNGGNGTTGGAAGGFNGGGAGGTGGATGGAGGGGASDIRTVSRNDTGSLASRLIVAGGGGGRAGNYTLGGAPGNAGLDGFTGQGFQFGSGGTGGGAGTASAGGAAGTGGSGATAGSLGTGGRGGNGSTADGGGGAGGGYYGGGGGGGSTADGYAGGGGGGSSFTGTAQNTAVEQDSSGTPAITIAYTVDVTPDPTSAPDTGVVDADVTVPAAAACIELSTTAVTFGTQRFGSENVAATPGITVTNCSGSDETLLARVTAAAGDGALWTPVDDVGSCAAGTLRIDEFHLKLRRTDTEAVTFLGNDNKAIRTLAAGGDGTLDALLDMPCPGSSGAGQTMGLNIVFVVTEQ